jgi:hypothetical protein
VCRGHLSPLGAKELATWHMAIPEPMSHD